MKTKLLHLSVILFGYIACIYSMILTWNLFSESSLIFKVLVCHIEATIFIYFLSVIFNNSSWYDAFWSVIPVVLTIMCWADISAAGDVQRAFLMHACLLLWAIRLTYNWMRSWEGFSHEDWRYIMMKGKTKNKFQYFIVDFGSIHLIPTLCVYMALLPRSIGYIYVERFQNNTFEELIEHLETLNELETLGLILDLRGNPGSISGSLSIARDIKELYEKLLTTKNDLTMDQFLVNNSDLRHIVRRAFLIEKFHMAIYFFLMYFFQNFVVLF